VTLFHVTEKLSFPSIELVVGGRCRESIFNNEVVRYIEWTLVHISLLRLFVE
jgi:hypothetical protein